MIYLKYIARLFLIALGRSSIVLFVCFLSIILVLLYYNFLGDPRCADGYNSKEGEMIICKE